MALSQSGYKLDSGQGPQMDTNRGNECSVTAVLPHQQSKACQSFRKPHSKGDLRRF